MDNKFSNIKERILYLIEYKGDKREDFFKKIGMSYGNFKGEAKKTPLNSNAIENILSIYKDISPEWLLTGSGEMFKKYDQEKNIVASPDPLYSKKIIPLVTQSAVAGFSSSNFSISEQDVKDYYVIPKFKYNRVDFMIEVSGSSMYPKYNSGDIVACTIIKEESFIQWNKCYVIATKEQGILVKRIKKGDTEDKILAISDNKDYDPFQIPRSEITGIALVIGVIRLE